MLIDTIKVLLGIDDDSADAALEVIAAEVSAAVKAYVHKDELSDGLEAAAARIAADVYNNVQAGGVKSIGEGERQVEFDSVSGGGYIGAYADILNIFRDKRGYVPSDIFYESD